MPSCSRQLLELADLRDIAPGRVIEQWVLGGLAAGLADAEDHGLRDLVHHLLDVRLQVVGADIGARPFDATGNIVANSAWRNRVAVGHHAPDDRVAISAIRAAMTQLGYFSGAALGGAALAAGGYAALTHVLAGAFVLAVIPHITLVTVAHRRRAAPVPA